ncbi:MAG TPA: hypothetical protein VGU43_00485 [Thermoplasmata archaeon]|nr:hypothetical protein [Thermoplasmata archaeon]
MSTEPAVSAAPDKLASHRHRRPVALGALAALALLALAAVPLLGTATAAPVANGGAQPATGTLGYSLAWGAAENVSIHLAYVGAYTSALNLSGGNLTTAGAYVAVNESFAAGYLAYAVVNATEPSASTLSVEVGAIELSSTVGAIAIAGTLPVAGTYAPGAPVPLAQTSSSLWLSEQTAQGYLAFANYTVGPNGSLALTDEHLRAVEAVNLSLSANNFPNSTLDPNGSTTVKYTTASIAEAGWVGENLSASFSPGLLVSDPPLAVGKSWNTSSQASFVGMAGYASEVSYSTNGTSVTEKHTGAASLNASGAVSYRFTVTGTENLSLPNGTTVTGYTVGYTSGSGSGSYRVWDGLLVLPGSDPTQSAGLRPATPAKPAADLLSPQAEPRTAAVHATGQELPVAAQSRPTSGPTLLASPVTPQAAEGQLHHGSPASVPSLPSAPGSAGPQGGILPVLLLAGLVVVVGAFFVHEARRSRAKA